MCEELERPAGSTAWGDPFPEDPGGPTSVPAFSPGCAVHWLFRSRTLAVTAWRCQGHEKREKYQPWAALSGRDPDGYCECKAAGGTGPGCSHAYCI